MTVFKTNEALESLDLEQILSNEGVDYKVAWGRSGKQLNVRSCPFCGNNNHKVYINANTGLGNCFAGSCSQGTFNKWQWLKEMYGIGGRELHAKIEFLAHMQGWRPTVVPATKYDPGELALPPCKSIRDLPAAPRYLQARGITLELSNYFDLRYCESGRFSVTTPDGKSVGQDYSGRIILPIFNLKGQLVSFQGRDATGTAEKRYLFPPMFSSTGSQLYNINNWQPGIMDTVIICEGPFDVIAVQRMLFVFGIKNVLPVGSFGMNFSISTAGQDDQLNRLMELKKLGLKNVCMMWDNEPAAIARALETCLQIRRYDLQTKFCRLNKSKDPGEATNQELFDSYSKATPITSPLQIMVMQAERP